MSNRMLLMLSVSFVTSCSGNVKELNCSEKNWKDLGFQYGSAGKNIHHVDEQLKACNFFKDDKIKISYADGYTKGILKFCTFENGFAYGSENKKNPKVCPLEVRKKFEAGYAQGMLDFREKFTNLKNASEPSGKMSEKNGGDQEAAARNGL
jgi:hypothetical protein